MPTLKSYILNRTGFCSGAGLKRQHVNPLRHLIEHSPMFTLLCFLQILPSCPYLVCLRQAWVLTPGNLPSLLSLKGVSPISRTSPIVCVTDVQSWGLDNVHVTRFVHAPLQAGFLASAVDSGVHPQQRLLLLLGCGARLGHLLVHRRSPQ